VVVPSRRSASRSRGVQHHALVWPKLPGLATGDGCSARTWIVLFSLAIILWFAVALLPGSPSAAALVTLPIIALTVQNGLQHTLRLLSFRQYAPGVITYVFLIIPLGGYIAIRTMRRGYAPAGTSHFLGWSRLSGPGAS